MRHLLKAGPTYRVGRDPDADIVLADGQVSWMHGELGWSGAAWTYTDLGSRNGSFLNGAKVDRVDITDGATISLGSPNGGPALSCAPAAKRGTDELRLVPDPAAADPGKPASVTSLPATSLQIGRGPNNDIVVDDPLVSRRHAELRHSAAGLEIVDLGSRNGIYVNGARVSSAPVAEGHIIRIGRSTFRLAGGSLVEYVDRGAALVARNLVVTVRRGEKKRLLDGVTFSVPGGSLLAVVGPSGAGKSTLVRALTGKGEPNEGTVLYEDRDLYKNYEELRLRIGHVPQEDILHPQLTARRALQYSGELRFAPDLTAAERNERVDAVLRDLKLDKHAGKKIRQLSGGQRKRVSMALELMARPSLLVLDEPTSGLDPYLDLSVLQDLRRMSRGDTTIIVVTHNVMHLAECDQLLVMAPGGHVAFHGPPAAALGYFRVASWTEVFQKFEDEPGRDWAGEFRQSPYYAEPDDDDRQLAAWPERSPDSPRPQPRPDWFQQAVTLTRRYARVSSDPRELLELAALPLVVGLLIRFFPLRQGLAGIPGTNVFAQEVLEIMVTCACLAGATSSIRELVKERPIYERERAAGLSSRGYLASKLVLLFVISVVQSAIMIFAGLAGRRMPSHGVVLPSALWELWIAIALLAVASMCVGLLVSAFVKTSEQAMQRLVTITMAQVILSGGLLPLAGRAVFEQLSWFVPARWGFAAVASTVNLNSLNPPGGSTDSLWAHGPGNWLRDIALVLTISAVCAVLTWDRLRRLDSGRR